MTPPWVVFYRQIRLFRRRITPRVQTAKALTVYICLLCVEWLKTLNKPSETVKNWPLWILCINFLQTINHY